VREREREREREKEIEIKFRGGGSERYCQKGGNKKGKIWILKVPRHCPLVLLVK
jgi:hypothetical protein